MERLDWLQRINRQRYLRLLGVAVLLFAALAVYIKTSAVPIPSTQELAKYLEQNNLSVGTQITNDFQHVYYDYGRVRVPVTEGESNNFGAVTSGPYIAWIRTDYGDNQRLVYLYDALGRITKQLTFYGNASKLAMDKNLLVWEQTTIGDTKIYYYDGQQVKKLESDHISLRPQVKDGVIAYVEVLGEDSYRVKKFYADTATAEVVKTGDSTNTWPRFVGDELVIGGPF